MNTLATDRRREIAAALAGLSDHHRRVNYVRAVMTAESIEKIEVEKRTDGFRLRLLGRVATCTYSADGAIGNWIAATLKEAGLK